MFNSAKFPVIDYDKVYSVCNDYEKQLLPLIFHAKESKTHKKGELRKSKVKFNYPIKTKENELVYFGDDNNGKRVESLFSIYRFTNSEDEIKACASYVWRDIAFTCVNKYPYNCLPVNQIFDLMFGTKAEQNERKVKLQNTIDKILSFIPKSEWESVNRWGKALGLI